MSPENVCPRFKQNAWKKELCSNCFRPKEEHPQKPKRVHVDYKPLPEVSPAQSILKGNSSCDKSRKVSFSNIESEIIGYGGEEYSTDEDYSSDEEPYPEYCADSGEEEELKRLTEANTNLNGKLIVPEKTTAPNNVHSKATPKKPDPAQNKSPPLVIVQPFGSGEQPKSLVFNFLKNKEIAAAAKVAQQIEKKDTENEVQLRKTETLTKKPTLSRSSLVAHSNESYLNIKRCSLPADEDEKPVTLHMNVEIPKVKLHPPETNKAVEKPAEETEVLSLTKEPDVDSTGLASYKTRSNVPRMGTMHFKLKLAVASTQKPADSSRTVGIDSTPESSSLTSREMAGEPDGKADSDEPGDPTITSQNRSFLHNFKDNSTPLRDLTTPTRTPLKKISITSNSPPECPRSIKRQAPKPPPPPPSVKCSSDHGVYRQNNVNSSFSIDDFGPDEVTIANRKLLAEYCEQIEKEQSSPSCGDSNGESPSPEQEVGAGDELKSRESSTLPLPAKRPAYEKKKYGKAGKVGLKIKKFLRFPSRDLMTPQQSSPRPKLEIIHPLDINKSGVEIIHNVPSDLLHAKEFPTKGPPINHYTARPTKPPPPPRSLPPTPLSKSSRSSAADTDHDNVDAPKTFDDSSASDEMFEPVNFSAPECDHSSSEMARLTSLQYCGSETESETYPTIQFGDDFGAEDSIRNTRPGHKSLEESYDAVVIANHEALTKLLDQETCEPKIPKELMVLKNKSLEWSSFHVDPTSRLQKSNYAFYNSKWCDIPVVLSVSSEQVKLNNVLNNHFTLTKVTQFVSCLEKEFSPVAENEDVYVTLWSAHQVETIESYCKEHNAKYTDVTNEAGLILVETVNLLISLQNLSVDRYSLEPFVVTRNIFGADPTVALIQLESNFKEKNTLCEIMLKVLRLLVPTWEMTICLSQVLHQDKPNSLSKCKALLEFWLWGPTGVTVTPDRPMSLKRWLDLERANVLHGHVCSRSSDLSVKQICYMSFLVVNDDKLFSDTWTVLANRKMQPPCDPTISKC